MIKYILDANPLIYIYNAGGLPALVQYAQSIAIIIPDQVYFEVLKAPDPLEVAAFQQLESSGLIEMVDTQVAKDVAARILPARGAGEKAVAEVLQTAPSGETYVPVTDNTSDLVKLGIPASSVISTVTLTNTLISNGHISTAEALSLKPGFLRAGTPNAGQIDPSLGGKSSFILISTPSSWNVESFPAVPNSGPITLITPVPDPATPVNEGYTPSPALPVVVADPIPGPIPANEGFSPVPTPGTNIMPFAPLPSTVSSTAPVASNSGDASSGVDLTTAAEIGAGALTAAGAVLFAPEILGAAAIGLADAGIGALGEVAAGLAEGALGTLSEAVGAAADGLLGAAEAGASALGDGLASAAEATAGALKSAAGALEDAAAGGAGALAGALAGLLGPLSPAAAQPPDPTNPASGSYVPDAGGDFGGAQHDPLVIDFAGNGLNLVSRSAFSPYFDFSGSGFAQNTAWIGAGTGFLAIVGTDGLVHDGTQLFGTGAQSGFQALRALDSNGDGIISASDANFSKLVVWQDINGDGVCQSSEVFTLGQLGIASISLHTRAVAQSVNGATISETATVTMVDGSARKIAEASLDVSSVYTRYVGSYTLDPAVYALPGLQGYGTLPSLSISMSQDGQLKTLVQQLVQTDPSNVGAFDQALRAALYRWAGVDAVSSTSSDLFDRQALGFLRALLGNTSNFLGFSDGPFLSDQIVLVQKSWNEAFAGLKARVLAQLPNSPFQASFTVFPGADLLIPRGQLSAAITYLGQNAPSNPAAQVGYWSNVLLLVNTSVSDFQQFGTPDVSSITANLQSVVPAFFSPEMIAAAASGALNIVEGSAGTNNLVGTWSSDLFTVDQANATLTGFGGGDEFVVGSGLGAIEINEADYTGQSANMLLLTGAAPSQVSVSGDAAGDIILTLGSGDTVKLDGMLTSSSNPADGSTQYGVQQIRFADGTVWGVRQLIQQELSATSNPDTVLYGASGADTLDGQGLKHVLQGNGGNDTFVFNQSYGALEVKEVDSRSTAANILQLGNGITASQVAVTGTANGDIVLTVGTAGDLVKLDGMLTSKRNGVQTVRFADGSTWSAQQLRALADVGASNNVRLIDFLGGATLDPAGYAHLVTTRGGNNTVLFNVGYGNVEINQHSTKAQDVNVLQFGAGIAPSQVTINGDTHGNVILTVGSNGDRVQLDNMLLGSGNGVQAVHFADGTIWSAQQIVSQVPGGSGADQYFTTFSFDKGVGAAASVVLGHGAITLGSDIAAGDVYLQTDGAGDLIVRLRDAPDDSLTIGNAIYSDVEGVHSRLNQLTYANGATLDLTQGLTFTWLADSTSLALSGSNDGANVFELAPGGDVVTGSSQTANTFVFHKGDGHATILPTGGSGLIKLATDIAASDVALQANTVGDLVVQLRDTGDSLTIKGDLSSQPWGVQSQVSQITFGDGTTLALGQPDFDEGLPLSFTWVGTGAAPLVGSGFGSNIFIIGPGSAHVLAGNGAQGGSDANTFVFAKGDANAVIDMNGGAGTLVLGADIPASDIIFQANAAGDLTVALRDDPTDSIVFKGDLSSQPWGVQSQVSQITFGDDTTLALGQSDFDQGQPLSFTWIGTASNTALVGSQGNRLNGSGIPARSEI